MNVRASQETTAIEHAGNLMLNYTDAIGFLQDRLAEIQEKHDVRFSPDHCYVLSGRPFEEICKLARQINADLIVMPTRGQSGFKRILLGSTAERVVRYAPCPVLIARGKKYRATVANLGPKSKLNIRKMLVPVDFSECSLAGIKYAAFLGKGSSAKLRLLHVVSPYTQTFVTDRDTAEPVALIASAKKHAQEEMEKLRHLKFLRDAKCESQIRFGSTIEEICTESTQPEIDLLVTSTHGRTGFRHALIGSVAEHVARYAECPVMVVPSRGEL